MNQPTLVLTPDADNATGLCRLFGLSVPSDVAHIMTRFTITADGVETTVLVEEKRYLMALLILYFHRISSVKGGEPFQLTDSMMHTLADCVGPKVMEDAEQNPHTGHTTIRAILNKERVMIRIVFDSGYAEKNFSR